MSTWSSRVSDAVAEDAEAIAATVERNLALLRDRRPRQPLQLESARVQPFQHGRNAVYRVSRRFHWFLKLPSNTAADVLQREVAGFTAVSDRLAAQPGYVHGGVRVSVDRGFMLSREFAGRQLNMALYRACILPLPGSTLPVAACAARVGAALARLHGAAATDATVARSGGRFFLLAQARALATDARPCPRRIGEWATRYTPAPAGGSSFIYGNFSVRNVLVSGDRFCFIDFENCGSGNTYEDLATMCSELILMRAVAMVPWSRVAVVLSSFLDGYAAERPYDPRVLTEHIAVQLCQYYMCAFLGMARGRSTRVAGLPVVRPRLERLIDAFIRGDGDGLLPPVPSAVAVGA